jgi:hypothetical protein
MFDQKFLCPLSSHNFEAPVDEQASEISLSPKVSAFSFPTLTTLNSSIHSQASNKVVTNLQTSHDSSEISLILLCPITSLHFSTSYWRYEVFAHHSFSSLSPRSTLSLFHLLSLLSPLIAFSSC